MRFAIDSNILIYALIREDPSKHAIASKIMLRSPELDAVVPLQAIGEFLNVIRRKHPEHFDIAVEQTVRWQQTLQLFATTAEHVVSGGRLAARHRLQLWDAIIWQVADSARAALLLSEDFQDGFSIGGLRVLNPFGSNNSDTLESLLVDCR